VIRLAACLCMLFLMTGVSLAQDSKPPSKSATAFDNPIPNIPGKKILGILVEYPPGGATPPHHHAPSAFITAYVISGAVRSQVDDGPARVYHAGEYFTENPGSHHRISENASATEPAKMLAIFVMDQNDAPLTRLDK
jgi:quercetin dioxygenase-like cupin family protein